MKKVSVIVPVYNAEKYLRKCIESILAQTYTEFELLLIDDGSKDSSGAICDEYAKKDSRIRVFHQDNAGVSAARNNGLDNANGEYIAFIDADDFIETGYLAAMFYSSSRNNSDLIISGYKRFFNGTYQSNREFSNQILDSSHYNQLFQMFPTYYLGAPWCKLHKKSIIDQYNIRFKQGVCHAEDFIFYIDYIKHSKTIELISDTSYHYMLSQSSSSLRFKPFEKEKNGYEPMCDAINSLKQLICNDDYDNKKIEFPIFDMTMRMKMAIYSNNYTRKERISMLKQLDLDCYCKYASENGDWKNKMLTFLLKHRFFYLHDLIYSLKR